MTDNITEIPTPYYLFDKERFTELLQAYQQMGDVYYPIKANDDDLIVNTVINLSCCFEVDSIEHIRSLVKVKEVEASRILYSYPIREEKDIIEAVQLGIKKFVVDSKDEYTLITKHLDDGAFFVRLNTVGILGSDLPPHRNKWGLSISKAKELIVRIRNDGNKVLGISFYLFEDIAKPKSLKGILEKICENFSGFHLEYLNIGGGFSVQRLTEVKKLLDKTKSAIGAKKIIIEPGKPLLDPCIDMVVSVMAIKKIGTSKLVFINAGIYSGLIDVVIKGRHFEICDLTVKNGDKKETTLVCGSSSDVSDFLGEYELRSDLAVRDQLLIRECGGYSTVMQTNFYGKNRIEVRIRRSSANGVDK